MNRPYCKHVLKIEIYCRVSSCTILLFCIEKFPRYRCVFIYMYVYIYIYINIYIIYIYILYIYVFFINFSTCVHRAFHTPPVRIHAHYSRLSVLLLGTTEAKNVPRQFHMGCMLLKFEQL